MRPRNAASVWSCCDTATLVRSVVAAKVPRDAVDDVESDVWLRFSRKVYSGGEITNPVGLLLHMASLCRADFHARRPADEPELADWDAAPTTAALDGSSSPPRSTSCWRR